MLSFAFLPLRLLLGLAVAGSAPSPSFRPAVTDPPRPVVETDSTLLWHPARRLTWDLFRQPPPASDRHEALTSTDLSIQVSCSGDDVRVNVQAVFLPLKSWTKSTDSAPLLRHEQGHFDLTEIYARRLRQTVLSRRLECHEVSRQLPTITNSVYAAWEAAENRYDAETRHGLDREAQAKWEKYIETELAKGI